MCVTVTNTTSGNTRTTCTQIKIGPAPAATNFTLMVQVTGDGTGTVRVQSTTPPTGGSSITSPQQVVPLGVSEPINCMINSGNPPGGEGDCEEVFPAGTSVVLFVSALSGVLTWTGCDEILNSKCNVVMDADKTVTADFKEP